jgi:hypothetical protein
MSVIATIATMATIAVAKPEQSAASRASSRLAFSPVPATKFGMADRGRRGTSSRRSREGPAASWRLEGIFVLRTSAMRP